MTILRPTLASLHPAVLSAMRNGLPWDESGGRAPPAPGLDLFSGGTFTRASEASYLIGAPTDGSAAFMAWAASNVRRISNRGDGLGDMLLMEGGRTNLFLRSEEADNASWTKVVATATADLATAPDGASDADRISLTANALARIARAYSGTDIPDATAVALTTYMKGAGQSARIAIQGRDAVRVASSDQALAAAWARIGLAFAGASGASNAQAEPVLNASDAAARDVDAWGWQGEVGCFWPSSYIRTAGAAATRAADVLTYADGQYPASFATRGFRIRYVPDYSSAELIAETISEHRLLGVVNANNLLRLIKSSGSIRVQVLEGGLSKLFVGSACTWSRGQVLTIEVRPNDGVLVLSGFTAGNGTHAGTPFTWPTGTLGIGNSPAGAATTFCFGRFGRYIEAL